jgi:Protein of unknown function (DUF4435)
MAGDFVETLEAEARTPTAIFHQLRLAYYGSRDSEIFLFVEGEEDRVYYLTLVSKYRNMDHIEVYVCNGKAGVLALHELSRIEFGVNHRMLFFVDRDYDELLGLNRGKASNLYTTDGYSCENGLVSEEAIRVLWRLHTPYRRNDARLGELLRSYSSGHQRFVRIMRPLMAWSLSAREQGLEPKLSLAPLAKFVRLEDRETVRRIRKGFVDFRGCCELSQTRVCVGRVKEWARRLSNEPLRVWLRGKYDLWFFIEWIKRSWAWLERVRKQRGEQRRIHQIQTSSLQMIRELAASLPCPESLAQFLRSNLFEPGHA